MPIIKKKVGRREVDYDTDLDAPVVTRPTQENEPTHDASLLPERFRKAQEIPDDQSNPLRPAVPDAKVLVLSPTQATIDEHQVIADIAKNEESDEEATSDDAGTAVKSTRKSRKDDSASA